MMRDFEKNMHTIEASVLREASEFKIFNVLVALSGGADSIATALLLKKIGLKIKCLHCNFHLRGEESDRDFDFVKDFCNFHNLPLETIDFDVCGYLKDNSGFSVEMACRNLRHDWFKKKSEEEKADRLVTGHNADDNIETFMLNMLRGSGTRGLRGMKPDNGYIWRPLLSFHREEILEYLAFRHQPYVVDSTNLQSDYRRNYLRNEIIPRLKKEWKGFNNSLDKTISNINMENEVVEKYLALHLPPFGNPLSVETVSSSPAPLLLIRRFIDFLGPYATTANEILSAIKANKPHIRRWRLKYGVVFLRNGNLFVEMGHGERCT